MPCVVALVLVDTMRFDFCHLRGAAAIPANGPRRRESRVPSPSSMAHAALLVEGERALAQLQPKLEAVSDTDLLRPGTDPHSAGMTALLVADFLAQPEIEA